MNVMLIGDSVRMFYREEVKKALGQDYCIYGPDENCRFAAYTLNSLRHWLPQFPAPDIIHWNNGLWDMAILYKEDGCFTPLEVYVDNMKKILRELKKTGAKIIFATTTPVHDEKVNIPGPMPPAHSNEDIIRYNKAIIEAFSDEDIIINDLFGAVYNNRAEYISDDMIHPNESGVAVLAKAVADAIKSCGEVKNLTAHSINSTQFEEKTIQ